MNIFKSVSFVLWLISCIIAIPFVLLGFIYESAVMGFNSGKDFAWVVFSAK